MYPSRATTYAAHAALAAALCVGVFFAWVTIEGKHIQVPRIIPTQKPAHIFAAGDIMLDRQIRQVGEKAGYDYLFSCIDPLVESADMAVANLEGPITNFESLSVGSAPGSLLNYYFTFASTTAGVLARHHITAVDLGNNHILNFEYGGMQQTQHYLRAAGVGYFGGVRDDEAVFETQVQGVPLAFIGYNQFGGSASTTVAARVAKEAAAGRRVIVYTHWGDEYVDSSEKLRPTATLFAQAGASAVIGSHPHVVLGHEYIGDTLVYYSLGNFIFDQYFSDAVRHGLVLMLEVPKRGRVTAVEHPTQLLRDGRTCPAEN
jgi:poly-gamma-glutamate synthesis protein (capsule biosynthesis protein)